MKYSYHALQRGSERIFNISNPTKEDCLKTREFLDKVVQYSELHKRYIIDNVYTHNNKMLFLVIQDETVVTIVPRDNKIDYSSKGIMKMKNKRR